MSEQCSNCRFFLDEGQSATYCRRYPPVWANPEGFGWVQPDTKPNGWCGEHQLAPRVTPKTRTPLNKSGLALYVSACLQNGGLKYAEEAAEMTDAQLLRLPNLGRKSLAAIRAWQARQ